MKPSEEFLRALPEEAEVRARSVAFDASTISTRVGARRRRHRIAVGCFAAGIVAVIFGIAAGDRESTELTDLAGPSSSVPEISQSLVGVVTLVQRGSDQPRMCWVVVQTLPPNCDGPLVENLEWATMPWRESANGSVWAEGYVKGVWDLAAGSFRLVEVPGDPNEYPASAARLDMSALAPTCDRGESGSCTPAGDSLPAWEEVLSFVDDTNVVITMSSGDHLSLVIWRPVDGLVERLDEEFGPGVVSVSHVLRNA